MKRKKSFEENDDTTQNSEDISGVQTAEQTKSNKMNELLVFSNKCRVCLDTGSIPIFGDDLTPDISKDIETFGNLEIRSDDNFPKYICESCEKLLEAAVFFRKNAQQTDFYLKTRQQENVSILSCILGEHVTQQHNSETTHSTLDADQTKQQDNSHTPSCIIDAYESQSQKYTINTDCVLEEIKSEVEENVEDTLSDSFVNINEDIVIEPLCILDEFGAMDTLNDYENIVDENDELLQTDGDTITLTNKNIDVLDDYTCKTCNIQFETAKEYTQHKKTAEHKKAIGGLKIECKICFKNIVKTYFYRHMEMHAQDSKDDKLTCPICDKSYRKNYFNYHITHSHSKKDNKKDSEHIQCTVCNKSHEKHYYKFHLAIHNNDASKYVCDACGKYFIQQSPFKQQSLIHGSEKALKCTLGPNRGHPGLLKTHMQTYTHGYQHRCMECPASFLTKTNLNKHVQTHKGPVDFKCDHCKKGFYSKQELERHFEVDHLGVKNHVCNICGKTFGYKNTMLSHQLKVHKNEKLTNGTERLPFYLEADRMNIDTN